MRWKYLVKKEVKALSEDFNWKEGTIDKDDWRVECLIDGSSGRFSEE